MKNKTPKKGNVNKTNKTNKTTAELEVSVRNNLNRLKEITHSPSINEVIKKMLKVIYKYKLKEELKNID